MKTKITLLFFMALAFNLGAQTVWNGPTITFSKPNGADWNQEANQDRITSNVWLTRQNNNQIYNIAQETSAIGNCSFTPADTEWAVGTTANIGALTFESFTAVGNCAIGSPSSGIVAQGDLVLHLISEDIYIDIKFTYWGSSNSGGFTYERSTDPALSTNTIETQSEINVFPNPSSDYLNIRNLYVSDNKATIFDITGRKISKVLITNNKIDISRLNNGIYMLAIGNKRPLKFVKN